MKLTKEQENMKQQAIEVMELHQLCDSYSEKEYELREEIKKLKSIIRSITAEPMMIDLVEYCATERNPNVYAIIDRATIIKQVIDGNTPQWQWEPLCNNTGEIKNE